MKYHNPMTQCQHCSSQILTAQKLYLYSLPPQYEKSLRPLCQKPCKLVHQDILNLVCLLNLNTDAYAVDTGLDQNSFVFVSGDSQRIEQDFGGTSGFDLGDIVAF